jgi:hypothetical protein
MTLALAACDTSSNENFNAVSSQGLDTKQQVQCTQTIQTIETTSDGVTTNYETNVHWGSGVVSRKLSSAQQSQNVTIDFESLRYAVSANGTKTFADKVAYTSTSQKSILTTVLDANTTKYTSHVTYSRLGKDGTLFKDAHGHYSNRDGGKNDIVTIIHDDGVTSKPISNVIDGVLQPLRDYSTVTTNSGNSKTEVTTLNTPYSEITTGLSKTTSADVTTCVTTTLLK